MLVNGDLSQGYKTFFMLNSVQHEILDAHKYKISRNSAFLCLDKPRMLFFTLINVKCQQLSAF